MENDDRDLLQKEYFLLEEMFENFDSKALTIKAWSVTVSMAGIGAAYAYKTKELLILSAGSALLFWAIEALWKLFQRAYTKRIEEIESYFRSEIGQLSPLQISRAFSDHARSYPAAVK